MAWEITIYSVFSKAVATSNDFFKNLKITIEIGEIYSRFRSQTLVNLVATALEKNEYTTRFLMRVLKMNILSTVSVPIEPRGSIFLNEFLSGVQLIFDLPGVVIKTGFY